MMMIGAICRQGRRPGTGVARAALRALSSEAAPGLTLNFCLPHEPIYSGKQVEQVIIPGAAGEYGVTAGHSPIVSELQPGVVKIIHKANEEPEKFFVSAGFALTHANNVCDISAVEAVPVENLDADAVKDVYSQAMAASASASDDKSKATAQINLQTAKAMGVALGLNLA